MIIPQIPRIRDNMPYPRYKQGPGTEPYMVYFPLPLPSSLVLINPASYSTTCMRTAIIIIIVSMLGIPIIYNAYKSYYHQNRTVRASQSQDDRRRQIHYRARVQLGCVHRFSPRTGTWTLRANFKIVYV